MANPYQLACIAQTRSSFICRSQNKARGTDLKKEEWDVEGQSVQLAGEAGGRGERARCKHITSCRPLTTWGSGKTFLAFFPPSPHFPTNFTKFGLAHARGFLGAGRGFDGIGRRKDGWIGGWTSCHDDRVALSVCWLMKSLFACLSNQMAEQRMQHEQERTRLQQQHSAEKDSLVQEHQREVSSLERQARAALQQHQQHTQEWRKRDAQVGGLHWSTHSHAHTHTRWPAGLPWTTILYFAHWRFPGVSKAQQVEILFYLKQDIYWRAARIILETVCSAQEHRRSYMLPFELENLFWSNVARDKKVF